MSDLSIKKYVSLIISSELLAAEEIKQLYQEFQASQEFQERQDSPEITGQPDRHSTKNFAAYLETRELLTKWQNSKLLNGKFKGLKFGKFRILNLIGVGGMGRVFLAEDEILRRRVALKILPSERSQQAESLKRFHLEARALAQLDHENIVRVHDVSSEGKRHYIVMEYIPGVTLQKIVSRGGPLAPDVAVEYVRQTALGLSHAHDAGLIHRDIKPANLLLDESGTIKILDLGLALLATDDQNGDDHPDKAVGTADYISPEQAANVEDLDQRTDLYSLGCTLFFLLAGKPPFVRKTVAARLKAHRTELPPSINQFRKQNGLDLVSAELSILCGRLLAKNPDERFGSAKELLEELSTLDESLAVPSDPSTTQEQRTDSDEDWWDDDDVEDDATVTVVGNRTVEILRSADDKRETSSGTSDPVDNASPVPAHSTPQHAPISQSLEQQKQLVPIAEPSVSAASSPSDSAVIDVTAVHQSVATSQQRSRRKTSKQQGIPPVLIWSMVILSIAALVVGLIAGGVFG